MDHYAFKQKELYSCSVEEFWKNVSEVGDLILETGRIHKVCRSKVLFISERVFVIISMLMHLSRPRPKKIIRGRIKQPSIRWSPNMIHHLECKNGLVQLSVCQPTASSISSTLTRCRHGTLYGKALDAQRTVSGFQSILPLRCR